MRLAPALIACTESEKTMQRDTQQTTRAQAAGGQSRPFWSAFASYLQQLTSPPLWLPEPWRRPLVRYLLAALMQGLTIGLVILLRSLFPAFPLAGSLPMLVVALTALTLGAGSSFLSTLLGALLLDLFVLPPKFSWSVEDVETGVGIVLFLLTGVTISIVASQIERAHLAREQALREAQQHMDEFLSIASHELKNPLTTISATIQLTKRQLNRLGNGADSAAILKLLERAQRQITLQNRLVNDLLDVSRVRMNRLELQPRLCDLRILLGETVEDIRMVHPDRTIRLELPAEQEVLVLADTERIGQVITNYLTNALKYSPANRSVEVSLQVEGNQARIAVSDEGPGLSPAEQKHIWERFYRVEGIQVQAGSGVGLGLGLHICQAIILRHQGQVGVESRKGAGSTFWFTLPLVESV
jgi:signal transduction histidine kinase